MAERPYLRTKQHDKDGRETIPENKEGVHRHGCIADGLERPSWQYFHCIAKHIGCTYQHNKNRNYNYHYDFHYHHHYYFEVIHSSQIHVKYSTQVLKSLALTASTHFIAHDHISVTPSERSYNLDMGETSESTKQGKPGWGPGANEAPVRCR